MITKPSLSFPGVTARDDGTIISPHGRVMTGTPDGDGYLRVCISIGGVQKNPAIHRIVCEAFHGPRPTPRHQVRHLDGNNQRNYASNLQWGLPAENAQDTIAHGRRAIGEQHRDAKLTPEQVLEIRRLADAGVFQKVIAERFGVSQPLVSQIKRRVAWRYLKDAEVVSSAGCHDQVTVELVAA